MTQHPRSCRRCHPRSWLGSSHSKCAVTLAALQDHTIIHFAGHSDYDPAAPHKSGWRLHEGVLTAVELSKLAHPPYLVFSNSCQAGGHGGLGWGLSAILFGSIFAGGRSIRGFLDFLSSFSPAAAN